MSFRKETGAGKLWLGHILSMGAAWLQQLRRRVRVRRSPNTFRAAQQPAQYSSSSSGARGGGLSSRESAFALPSPFFRISPSQCVTPPHQKGTPFHKHPPSLYNQPFGELRTDSHSKATPPKSNFSAWSVGFFWMSHHEFF